MDITVRRKGGFAGVNERLGPVDTDTVDPEVSEQLESIVRDVGFFELPAAFPPTVGADLFEFTATVVEGDRSHSTSWDDLSDRPPELDRLLELLLHSGATWQPPVALPSRPPNPLFQPWIHSREEDTDEVEVYRPEGFDFPPSFGRDGFEIRPNGTFLRQVVGPADGTVELRGTWTARQITATFDDPAQEPLTLSLLSYDPDQLRRQRRFVEGEGGEGPAGVRSYRLLDFDAAEVIVLESEPPQFVLSVRGTRPYLNMDVRLSPLFYVRRPEYWGIEVVGCGSGLMLPAEAPFQVTLPLAGVTGTKGIEVIGASRTERLAVPPEAGPQLPCGEWSAFLDLEPPGPPVLRVLGSCTFPTAGYTVSLARHEPQGVNPRDLLLDLTVTEPKGPAAQVITTLEVRYEEEVGDARFDTVTILPDGVSIPVQEVH